jgi:hypothetical protein
MLRKYCVPGVAFVVGVFCSVALAGGAAAEPTSTSAKKVVCLPPATKISDSDINAFLNSPDSLLTANQSGGLPLVTRIRELGGSDSNTFAKISALVKNANGPQRAAIASGLANVVHDCGLIGGDDAQNYVLSIQTFVAGFGDPAFASTFQTASKEINVASVGPGAGPGSLGGGDTSTNPDAKNSNSYHAKDGPIPTTTGTYSFGSTNPFSSNADVLSPI